MSSYILGSSDIINKSFCFILKSEVKESFKIFVHRENNYSHSILENFFLTETYFGLTEL